MTLIAAALALLVGLSLGLLGGGGSVLTVPIFRYALGLGVKESIGMSLGVVSLVSALGALRHWRQGNFDARALVLFAPAAVISTYGGARLAAFVPDVVQMVGLGLVMLAASTLMWKGNAGLLKRVSGKTQRVTETPQAQGPRPESIIGIGLGLGFLTGIMGVGGGFLIVPALVLLLGVDMKRAVGTSLGVISLNAASGFAGYLGQVTMDWVLIGGFTAVAAVGVFIGAALVPKVSQEQLRKGFALFLVAVALFIFIKR